MVSEIRPRCRRVSQQTTKSHQSPKDHASRRVPCRPSFPTHPGSSEGVHPKAFLNHVRYGCKLNPLTPQEYLRRTFRKGSASPRVIGRQPSLLLNGSATAHLKCATPSRPTYTSVVPRERHRMRLVRFAVGARSPLSWTNFPEVCEKQQRNAADLTESRT
jgi:hypothetical protein